MIRRRWEKRVRVVATLSETRNGQRGEGVCTVDRVVFLLRCARVVEAEVRERGRSVTGDAISSTAACDDDRRCGLRARSGEEYLQAVELGRTEDEILIVNAEGAIFI